MYKIYKIIDNTNNNIYIGRTKQKYLSSRISGHRTDFKRGTYCSSQIILKNNDWRYELIEETDDISRESYWIQNTNNCINEEKHIFNKKEYDDKYHKIHKERYKMNSKKRYQNIKEQVKEKYNYINSWGGDPRNSNNLLKIKNIFD